MRRDLSTMPAGWLEGPESDTWIEHHERDGKKITVVLSALSKGVVDAGYDLISKAYNLHDDGRLTPAGYDVFHEHEWIGRFPTQKASEAALEDLKQPA
jgi:hypothetical protein